MIREPEGYIKDPEGIIIDGYRWDEEMDEIEELRKKEADHESRP